MAVTTLSSREFNQDTSRAKKAAQRGPVFITDRGRPAHVLLSIEQYQKLSGRSKTLAEALHMPGAAEIEFNPPKPADWMPKPAEFD
jgi:prevent-host-death family protein